MGLRATVRNGRLVVDEPTDLPEGTVLELVIDDEGDDLSSEDPAALHRAIGQGLRELENGEGIPAAKVLDGLRKR